MTNEERWERIVRFNNGLSIAEKEIVRLYLTVFYDKYSNSGSIYSNLFETLSKNDDFEILHSKFSPDALRKNLERLEQKILEALSLEVNTSRRSTFDQVDRDYLRVLSLIKHYKILALSGNAVDALPILRRILKISRRIELFDFALFALYQIADISVMRNISTKSLDVFEEIENTETSRELFNKSLITKYKLFKLYLVDRPNQKQLDWLLNLNNILDEIKQKQPESSTRRNILYGQLLYFDKVKNYSKCLKICQELEILVAENYPIRKDREITTIKINRVIFGVLDQQFENSLSLVREILSGESLTDINKSYLITMKARLEMCLGEYEPAIQTVSANQDNEWFSNSYKAQCDFIMSVCYYMIGDYTNTINTITSHADIRKDKSGWNFYARLLLIMSFYKLENTDVAINELENFKRYLHGKSLNERQQYQNKLITSIVNSKPATTDVVVNESWDPTSAEVLDFNELLKQLQE